MIKKFLSISIAIICIGVLSARTQTKIKATAKEEISLMLGSLKSHLTEDYFDKKKGIDLVKKLTEMEKKKVFDGLSSIDAAQKVTDILREETGDKHFRVSVTQRFSEVKDNIMANQRSISGFSKVSILKHSVGYIKWDLCNAGEEAFKTNTGSIRFPI
ncbi:hypothetical protein [Pedobacter steynii]